MSWDAYNQKRRELKELAQKAAAVLNNDEKQTTLSKKTGSAKTQNISGSIDKSKSAEADSAPNPAKIGSAKANSSKSSTTKPDFSKSTSAKASLKEKSSGLNSKSIEEVVEIANKKFKKKARKTHIAVWICVAIFAVIGIFGGVFAANKLCENDCFVVLGEKNIESEVGTALNFTDEGVKIISFGRDISNKVKIKTNLTKNAEGNYIIDTSKEMEYYLIYMVDDIKYGNIQKVRTISIIVPQLQTLSVSVDKNINFYDFIPNTSLKLQKTHQVQKTYPILEAQKLQELQQRQNSQECEEQNKAKNISQQLKSLITVKAQNQMHDMHMHTQKTTSALPKYNFKNYAEKSVCIFSFSALSASLEVQNG